MRRAGRAWNDPMDDLILHHHPTSPFSEKVRVALGITGLEWRSVIKPAPR